MNQLPTPKTLQRTRARYIRAKADARRRVADSIPTMMTTLVTTPIAISIVINVNVEVDFVFLMGLLDRLTREYSVDELWVFANCMLTLVMLAMSHISSARIAVYRRSISRHKKRHMQIRELAIIQTEGTEE